MCAQRLGSNALAPDLLDIDGLSGNTLDGGLAYDPNAPSAEVG